MPWQRLNQEAVLLGSTSLGLNINQARVASKRVASHPSKSGGVLAQAAPPSVLPCPQKVLADFGVKTKLQVLSANIQPA